MPFGVTTYSGKGQYGGAVGLLQAANLSLSQNFETQTNMDTLGINSFRYNLFQQPSEVIDSKIQSDFLNPIKDRKNTIITLGGVQVAANNMEYYGSTSAAFSALESLYGNASSNDGVISSRHSISSLVWTGAGNTAGINVSAGTAVSTGGISGGSGVALFSVSASIGEAARVDIVDVSGNISAGTSFFVDGTEQSAGATSLEFAAHGTVYQDEVIVLNYPRLHPPDPSALNPLSDIQFKILPVNGQNGAGSGQTYYRNSIQGSYGSFPNCDDTFPTQLGNVYTVSVNQTNIASNRSQINVLRGADATAGIQSFVGAGSTVKNARQEYAINQWSLVRNSVNTQSKINSNNSIVSILENIAFQP